MHSTNKNAGRIAPVAGSINSIVGTDQLTFTLWVALCPTLGHYQRPTRDAGRSGRTGHTSHIARSLAAAQESAYSVMQQL